jgi:hypothetical protein
MPALMAYRLVPLLVSLAVVGVLGACGKEIGDACSFSTDCDPNGNRTCIDTTLAGGDGYCTVQGCDYSTCPGEATCVQFFTGDFSNKPCDPTMPADSTMPADPNVPNGPRVPADCTTAPNCCSLDELCSLSEHCVPRSSEIRYCMRTCSSDGDCRDGYECRDLDKMKAHGGQPVLAPGAVLDARAPKFCAKTPS